MSIFARSVGVIIVDFIAAVLRLLDEESLALSDDLPIAHGIFGFDDSFGLEHLLDYVSSLRSEFLLLHFLFRRLRLCRVLNFSHDLGLLLLSGLTARGLISLALALTDFRERVGEPLVRGLGWLLFWRLRVWLRLVPKLAISDLFLYGLGLHLLLGVVVFLAVFVLALVVVLFLLSAACLAFAALSSSSFCFCF